MKILSVELERTWTYLRKQNMKILSVELERTWTYLQQERKNEDIVTWTKKNLNLPLENKICRCQLKKKELEPTYEKQRMKVVELERTWTYIWKTKDEGIVSWTGKNFNLPTTGEKKYEDNDNWTRKNLNLHMKNKEWRYCQLN